MKYKAVIETNDYKGFEFYEDGNGKYMVGKDANVTAVGHGWIPLYFTECEEESIIDKVRAEIDAESTKSFRYPNWERAKALEWALNVIDKYKKE